MNRKEPYMRNTAVAMNGSANVVAVSVVMPLCNGIKAADRAVRSMHRQTVASWELMAIDDGSTYGSYDPGPVKQIPMRRCSSIKGLPHVDGPVGGHPHNAAYGRGWRFAPATCT